MGEGTAPNLLFRILPPFPVNPRASFQDRPEWFSTPQRCRVNPGKTMKTSVAISNRSGRQNILLRLSSAVQAIAANGPGGMLVQLAGRILFPKAPDYVRRRDTLLLCVSLALGIVFCVGFGWVLFTLNKQGRI
jgi:hypothetical protein